MKMRTRALAATTIGAVALSTAVAVAPTATAAPNAYSYSAARWLEDQLENDVVVYPDWQTQLPVPDYGASLDVVFALSELDTKKALQGRIVDAVVDHRDDYLTSPGRKAKLAIAVDLTSGDPRAVDGRDLVDEVEDVTDSTTGVTTGAESGLNHVFVTRTLVRADSSLADESVASLLTQQCENGSFKDYTGSCPAIIDVDTTASALQALVEASRAGIVGLQGDIDAATSSLLAAQEQDGSFGSEWGSNSNSTGLAASALALVGEKGAAGSAAAWLLGHQITESVAEASPALATQAGAIAYDDYGLSSAKASGIGSTDLGSWILATGQATAGLQALLPAASVSVKQSAVHTTAGGSVTVTATGLLPGEKFTARISGGSTVTGTVPARGIASASLKAPAGTSIRTVALTGSRTNRSGSTKASVLAAKKVGVKLAKTKVKRTKVQTVKVTGLSAKEPITVSVRGKAVRKGTATASGTYTYRFKVGTKLGKAKVVVKGAFANRNGTKTFTVVK